MSLMREISNSTEEANFTASNGKSVVFYGSRGCGHCNQIKPVVDQLVRMYPNVKFGHVETSRVDVQNLEGVPTFVGYRNNVYVDMVVGADQQKLQKMIQSL